MRPPSLCASILQAGVVPAIRWVDWEETACRRPCGRGSVLAPLANDEMGKRFRRTGTWVSFFPEAEPTRFSTCNRDAHTSPHGNPIGLCAQSVRSYTFRQRIGGMSFPIIERTAGNRPQRRSSSGLSGRSTKLPAAQDVGGWRNVMSRPQRLGPRWSMTTVAFPGTPQQIISIDFVSLCLGVAATAGAPVKEGKSAWAWKPLRCRW